MVSTMNNTHCKYKLSTVHYNTILYKQSNGGGGGVVGRAKCSESDTTTRILSTQLAQYTSFALTCTVEFHYKNSAEGGGGRDKKQFSSRIKTAGR